MRTAALLAGHGGDDDGRDQQTHTQTGDATPSSITPHSHATRSNN